MTRRPGSGCTSWPANDLCPACGYRLGGLREAAGRPRGAPAAAIVCPECGARVAGPLERRVPIWPVAARGGAAAAINVVLWLWFVALVRASADALASVVLVVPIGLSVLSTGIVAADLAMQDRRRRSPADGVDLVGVGAMLWPALLCFVALGLIATLALR